MAYGDFNSDSLAVAVADTNLATITVGPANPDGSYTVSTTHTAPSGLRRPVNSC